MEDVKIPGEPRPTGEQLIRNLTILASALTAASLAVNLILQVVHHFRKPPVQPEQREKVDTAKLSLTVLKHLPALIKQVRLLIRSTRARSASSMQRARWSASGGASTSTSRTGRA